MDDWPQLELRPGVVSLTDAEAAGYTHLEIWCRCGIVQRRWRMNDRPMTTGIARVALKLCCMKCGSRPERFAVTAQYMGRGYADMGGAHRR